ncbi:alkaline phosphatase-like isoform X2 [Paramacrobiotus metropolitanus]|uniref:alkaline phosphatase-like isoform X2 n=1 Tax=Paramacrobiotus metropolitanus TaxID=2943436 RepID=UPI0024458A2A|nr:alkaline phosphatase-like isoform X2 [Paramacrobiotus metropolitanus]
MVCITFLLSACMDFSKILWRSIGKLGISVLETRLPLRISLTHLICLSVFVHGVVSESPETWWTVGQDELRDTLKSKLNHNIAKNVIVFLGDGMGVTTVTAARILKGQLDGKSGEEGYLHFDRFPHTGLLKAYSNDKQVSESSASGTALFSGMKVNSETIGLDSSAVPKECKNSHLHHIDGLLLWAQQAGKSTGIISNTRVVDSTPASLYAHTPEEDWEVDSAIPASQRELGCKDISVQLIDDLPGRNINVILGGGRLSFLPQNHLDEESNSYGKRLDGRNLVEEWMHDKRRRNASAGYMQNKEDLKNMANAENEFLLGLFNPEKMSFAWDRGDSSPEPALDEMAVAAVRVLRRNPKGFFLMIEGGLIDDAHHRGMAANALHETIALDKAVRAIDDCTHENDTLLVVVADHSHSLLFLGYQKRGTSILGLANAKKAADGKPYTSLLYASGPESPLNTPRLNISGQDTSKLCSNGIRQDLKLLKYLLKHYTVTAFSAAAGYRQPAFIPSSWAMHMGEDVPVYAKGPMSHLFSGVHEQNYFAHAINYASCYRSDLLNACNSGQFANNTGN